MAYLTIARFAGDADELLDEYRRSSDVMADVGRDHGLLAHAAARTDDGVLIVNLWPSKDGSEAAARDPRRLNAIREAGIDSDQIQREHYEVTNHVLFG
jgi:hypothetical protein